MVTVTREGGSYRRAIRRRKAVVLQVSPPPGEMCSMLARCLVAEKCLESVPGAHSNGRSTSRLKLTTG